MRHKTHAILRLLAPLVGLAIVGCPQSDSGSDKGDSLPPSDDCDSMEGIDSITTIEEKGGRVDWLRSEDLIAFDKMDTDGYYDVWIMKPDGTDKHCLTCEVEELPSKHMGNPAWHPDGEWIVFQAEKENHPGGSDLCEPGIGWNNDLWAIRSDGSEFHQLTDIQVGLSTLHPQFSHDGSKLVWGESKTGRDDWAIKIADFDSDGGDLENVQTIRPGDPPYPVWYETHGFSSDGKKIIFTANLEPDQHWTGADIYTFELETHELTRLTESLTDWDEHAHLSPNDSLIVWMSSTGYSFDPETLKGLKTDFWLMKSDGSCKTRLTYFNEEGYDEYTGERVICGDNSWNADGTKIVGRLIEGSNNDNSRIVVMTLK